MNDATEQRELMAADAVEDLRLAVLNLCGLLRQEKCVPLRAWARRLARAAEAPPVAGRRALARCVPEGGIGPLMQQLGLPPQVTVRTFDLLNAAVCTATALRICSKPVRKL